MPRPDVEDGCRRAREGEQGVEQQEYSVHRDQRQQQDSRDDGSLAAADSAKVRFLDPGRDRGLSTDTYKSFAAPARIVPTMREIAVASVR